MWPAFLFGWPLQDQGYSSLSEDGGTSQQKLEHKNSHQDFFHHTVSAYNQKSNQVYITATMTKVVQKKSPQLRTMYLSSRVSVYNGSPHSHFPRSYFPIGLWTDGLYPEFERWGACSPATLLLGAAQVRSLPGTCCVQLLNDLEALMFKAAQPATCETRLVHPAPLWGHRCQFLRIDNVSLGELIIVKHLELLN